MEKLRSVICCLSDLYPSNGNRYKHLIYNIGIMEYYVAQKVKDEWGARPCIHPKIEKEYYTGAYLVNYVCVQCGKEFTIAQKLESDEKSKKQGD